MKQTYEAAGLEPERASTHSMRKTAATWLYEMTKDIKCVQSFLGHSDSETTEQYIDLAFRVVREGVAKFSERLECVFDEEKNDTNTHESLHFALLAMHSLSSGIFYLYHCPYHIVGKA